MKAEPSFKLKIFLCYSSGDKPAVRNVYEALRSSGFDPWFDKEDLVGGDEWKAKSLTALRESDVVLVCLSRTSINKRGPVQREIAVALDIAQEQPENSVFIVPVKLEECDVPVRLQDWHGVAYFEKDGHEQLLRALHPHTSVPRKRFSVSSIDRHATFFQTTKVGDIDSYLESVLPRKGEEWEMVAEWDAIPDLSLSRLATYFLFDEEVLWPRFIAWRPDGRALIVSRDHGNLTAWTRNGQRIGGKQRKDTHGWIHRAYWSCYGDWILVEGVPRFNYNVDFFWSVCDRGGTRKCWLAPDSSRFGSSNPDGYMHNQPTPTFNPWRPYEPSQFAKWNQRLRRFELYDINQVPPNIEESYERSVLQTIELSSLPVDGESVENFSWHPSGRYIGFVTVLSNPNTNVRVRRVGLLDWNSSQLVASTPPFVAETLSDFRPFAVGWSPGGQWLVLDESLSRVWDIKTGQVVTLGEQQQDMAWARRLRALKGSQNGGAWISCDGERRLHRGDGEGGEFGWEGTLTISSPGKGYLAELTGILNAAWSPTDPHTLATIERRLVRIWRLKGSPKPDS